MLMTLEVMEHHEKGFAVNFVKKFQYLAEFRPAEVEKKIQQIFVLKNGVFGFTLETEKLKYFCLTKKKVRHNIS